jgi:hypothetical protein
VLVECEALQRGVLLRVGQGDVLGDAQDGVGVEGGAPALRDSCGACARDRLVAALVDPHAVLWLGADQLDGVEDVGIGGAALGG